MAARFYKAAYDRFNEFLETYAPRGLYGRAMAIMITPVILLQLIMAGVIVERYWDNVTKVMATSVANDLHLLKELYDRSDKSDRAIDEIQQLAVQKLHLDFTYAHQSELPRPVSSQLFSFFDAKFRNYLREEIDVPFWVGDLSSNGQVEVRVLVAQNLVFKTSVDSYRAHPVGTGVMILLMGLSTVTLLAVAVIFMRNQIQPILELTLAAQAFGKDRENTSFMPQGATEVRLAGEAFLDMKRRIVRHVEQRTTMLAGVSHDLRTILTRFKLQLAVLGENPKVKPLRDDVNEMQQMLEDYMAFVRGDGGEQPIELSMLQAVQAVVDSFGAKAAHIETSSLPSVLLDLKPNAIRRLLTNVISNAVRYGSVVQITGETKDNRFWLYVDDNGPGIPEAHREDVFRPFVRLDEARNLDKSGTGLGLAIALDIAQAHGGDITLAKSALGGLRVAIKIPI